MEPTSKRIEGALLAIGALFLLTLGTSVIPSSWFGITKPVPQYTPLNLGSIASYESGASDANNDGVTTWKEFVTKSLGLPEEASTSLEIDSRSLAALNDPNNLTSSFSKNLYIASVALKDNGISDPATEQDTINQLVAKEAARLSPVTYAESSIKVGKSDSAASLKAYGNAMGAILPAVATEQTIADDLSGIAKFSKNQNEADLLPVTKSAKRLQDIVNQLLAVTVPPSAVATHVDILNRVSGYSFVLSNLSQAYDDPMRAALTVQNYNENAIKAIQSIPIMAKFFQDKNISFSSQEKGYVFIKGYTKQ